MPGLRRRWEMRALLVVLAVVLAACGRNPAVDSSNRGANSKAEPTSIQNAYIVPAFVPGNCAIQVGKGAELRFTVVNSRPLQPEQLLTVSTEASEVQIPFDRLAIPSRSTVAFGQPGAAQADAGGRVAPVLITRLDPDIKPGMHVDVTFHFEQAGDITMPVPIEACPTQAR